MATPLATAEILAEVPGGADLVAWFGRVPSLHDAEVLSVHLDRAAESCIRIHTWQVTNSVNEKGYFILDKHVVVTFGLEKISASKFEGFSGQNVISGFELVRHRSADDTSIDLWRNQFPPCLGDYGLILDGGNGMDGFVYARKLTIMLTPGKPVSAASATPHYPPFRGQPRV